MFKCAKCQKNTLSGEKCHLVVTGKRNKTYPFPPEKKKKERLKKFKKDEEYRTPISYSEIEVSPSLPVSLQKEAPRGWEIVKEEKYCEMCYSASMKCNESDK